MRTVLSTICLLTLASNAIAQIASVPLRLEMTSSSKQVSAGSPVSIRVTLKNLLNENTPALSNIPVTLVWPASGKTATLTIPRGQASAELAVTLSTPGLTKMQALAPKLPPAYMLLVVTSSETHPSTAPPPGVAFAPPPTTLAPDAIGAGSPVRLDLQVVPDQVDPSGSGWVADIGVALVGATGQPAVASEDVPVRMMARFGQVTPSTVTIRRGQIAALDDLRLTADRPGADMVAALAQFGEAQKPVVFNSPPTAKLRIEANPSSVVNDGRSIVVVTVMLLDGHNHPTVAADRDLCVTLVSSLGDLQDHQVCVARGNFWKETTLTSARHGTAAVTASAVGLEDASTTVGFLFPWLMLAMATAGGILGSFVRSGKNWAAHVGRNLAVAAILGGLFYLLALFGAVGAIPRLPFEAGKISTVNELGALVLGFIGGYYGQQLLAPARGRGQ